MGILGRARECCQLRRRHELFQLVAQLLPARTERLALAAEQRVGQLAGAEAHEPGEPVLLVGHGMAVLRLDGLQQADGGEVVGGAGLPAPGQGALTHEAEGVGRDAFRR